MNLFSPIVSKQNLLPFFVIYQNHSYLKNNQIHLNKTSSGHTLQSLSDITYQEPMSRSLQLPHQAYVTAFLQTDLFVVHLFFCEKKAVPFQ